jgi:hypothetical protein
MNRPSMIAAAVCLLGVVQGAPALAATPTEELGQCLVSSTNTADRNLLVKWMFASASAHPEVKAISNVTPAQIDDANKALGGLFMRLLTESCKEQAKRAVEAEGPVAFQKGFEALGQVAGRELFTDPRVVANMAGMQKFVDPQKLQSALGIAKP